MTSPHPSPTIQAQVETLRRRGCSWEDIAAVVKCARRQIVKHYRPHLPPELQAPLGNLWTNGKTLKAKVFAYLDKHADTSVGIVAAAVSAGPATVRYHVKLWRKAQMPPDPEPPRRCTCGLGLFAGEAQCALCEMQEVGLVVVYARPGWADAVGEYLEGEVEGDALL